MKEKTSLSLPLRYAFISGFNISIRKLCLEELDDSTLPHMQEALASKPHGKLLLFQAYNL